MDRASRLPTFWEAMLGAAVSVLVAAVILLGFESAAGVAPLLFGLVLFGYGLLIGLGWLVRRITG